MLRCVASNVTYTAASKEGKKAFIFKRWQATLLPARERYIPKSQNIHESVWYDGVTSFNLIHRGISVCKQTRG
jgi:hypothetical protein